MKRILIASFALVCLACVAWCLQKAEFETSLHHTGEGMRYWYEEVGGFKNITGVAYADLTCNECHVDNCGRCHTESDPAKISAGDPKPRKMETCLTCHARAAFVIKSDEAAGIKDVHRAAGLVCADCHKNDVHGDGIEYLSMRDPGAVKATCLGCHGQGANNAAKFDATTRSHAVHKGEVDCNACHVTSSAMCYNCHFDSFLETGKKEGNFIPVRGATLLVTYEGVVTAGSAQPLVGKERAFLAIGPYYTHSVMKEGRTCPDCHANEAVSAIRGGGKFSVSTFEDGKLSVHQGVIPVVDGKLKWVFLDKDESGWKILPEADPTIQYVGEGNSLTEAQMRKLALPLKE